MAIPSISRIDILATGGWFRGLILDNKNELADVSVLRILFEKLKGCFGGANRSDKRLITFKALDIIKTDQTSSSIDKVAKFAARAGLIDDSRTVTDNAKLVESIATKLFKSAGKSYQDLESIQREFYAQNQGVLKPVFYSSPQVVSPSAKPVQDVKDKPVQAPKKDSKPVEAKPEEVNTVIVINEQFSTVTTVETKPAAEPADAQPEEVKVTTVNEQTTGVTTVENKPVAEPVKIDLVPVEPKKTSLLMKCANYAIGTIGGLVAAKTVIESPVEKPENYTLTEQEAADWTKRDLTPGACPLAESMSKWKVVNIINEWLTDEVNLSQCSLNESDNKGKEQALEQIYGRFGSDAANATYPAIEYGLVFRDEMAEQSLPVCSRRWRVNEEWNWPDMTDMLEKTKAGFKFSRSAMEGGKGIPFKLDCFENVDGSYSTLTCEARRVVGDKFVETKFVETIETVLKERTFDACVSENGGPCIPQANANGEVLKNMFKSMVPPTQTEGLQSFNWSQYGVTALGAAIAGGCAHRAFQAFKRFGATCRNPETTFWERVETGVIPVMWIGLGVLNTYATMAAVEDLQS